MCGIVGSYRFNSTTQAQSLEFLDKLKHRGPDAEGFTSTDRLDLGMNRLKFRGADVPLPIAEPNFLHAYNGQVYGRFQQAGKFEELEDGILGEIHSSRMPGADGMFAVASFDRSRDSLTLATDRHFIKQIFVRESDNQVSFSSEMSALLDFELENRIHMAALSELFAYGWYLSDQTVIQDIRMLWKNNATIDSTGIKYHKKFEPVLRQQDSFSVEQLRRCIRASIEQTTRGCSTIGLALSGGLDSSIIAFELNDMGFENVVCITIDQDDQIPDLNDLSELGFAKVGPWQKWKHHRVSVNDRDFMHMFKDSTLSFGQPTTMSSLPLYECLAREAKSLGLRSLLLGEGIDEYFLGYQAYQKLRSLDAISSFYHTDIRQKLHNELFGPHQNSMTRKCFENTYPNLQDIRQSEVELRLTRLLLRSDVILMRHSIEGRVPFLHHGIPEIALNIAWEKHLGIQGKELLRSLYLSDIPAIVHKKKVRFKCSDERLKSMLSDINIKSAIIKSCSPVFGQKSLEKTIRLLESHEGFDADFFCLLLSLSFLIEEGVYDV